MRDILVFCREVLQVPVEGWQERVLLGLDISTKSDVSIG